MKIVRKIKYVYDNALAVIFILLGIGFTAGVMANRVLQASENLDLIEKIHKIENKYAHLMRQKKKLQNQLITLKDSTTDRSHGDIKKLRDKLSELKIEGEQLRQRLSQLQKKSGECAGGVTKAKLIKERLTKLGEDKSEVQEMLERAFAKLRRSKQQSVSDSVACSLCMQSSNCTNTGQRELCAEAARSSARFIYQRKKVMRLRHKLSRINNQIKSLHAKL